MKHIFLCVLLLLLSVLAYADPMWQTDVVVRDGQDLHYYGSPARDSFGNVLSAWIKSTQGRHMLFANLYQPSGTALWDYPILVQNSVQPVENLELHTTSDNCFILSWFEMGIQTGSQIKLQKLSSSGLPLWGDGITVVTERIQTFYEYSLAVDDQGGAYIFYKVSNGNTIYGRHFSQNGTELWGTNAPQIDAAPGLVFSGIASVSSYGVGLHYKCTSNQTNYVERYADYGYREWQQTYPFEPGEADLPHDLYVSQDHRLVEGVKSIGANTRYVLRVYGSSGNLVLPQPFSLDMADNQSMVEYDLEQDGLGCNLLVLKTTGTSSEVRYYKITSSFDQVYPAGGLLLSSINGSARNPQLKMDDTLKDYCGWIVGGAQDILKVNMVNNDLQAAWGQGISVTSSVTGIESYSLQGCPSNLIVQFQLKDNSQKMLNMQVLNQQGNPQLGPVGTTLVTAKAGLAYPMAIQPMGDRSIVFFMDENDEHEQALCYQIIGAEGYPVLPQPVVLGDYDDNPTYHTSCPWGIDNVMVVFSLGNNSYMQLINNWGDYGLLSPGMLIADVYAGRFKLSAYENDLYLGWMQQVPGSGTCLMGQRFSNWAWAWGTGGKVLVSNILGSTNSLTASDGRYYTWQGHNSGETYNKVYGLVVDANGDPATGWNPQGELLYDNPNDDDQRPFWAKSYGESLILVYGGYAPSQLFAQKIEPDHSQAWSVVINDGGAWFVDCASQDNGFGIITGTTFAGSGTVRYQFVSTSGELLHEAPGLLLANLLPYSGIAEVRLAAYDNGGFSAIWQNPNVYEDLELDYQTISPQGYTVESSPQLLSSSYGDKSFPNVCSLGNEAIVVWRNMSFNQAPDYQNPFQGLYAQKINGLIADSPDQPELPAASLNFKSCYPNPFKNSVQIIWEQKNPEPVQLNVYNLKGQLVKQIFSGTKGSGEQSIAWDGADSQNNKVGSGIYFLRLQSGNKVQTRKLIKW